MIGKTNSQVGGSSKGEKVNILLTSNQSELSALIGATISVSYGDNTTQYVWDGTAFVVDMPEYATYTVSVSDITGYKTPESITATAVKDNARTLTFTYQAEKVKVSVSASDGRNMSGTKVTINGIEKTFSGNAIEVLVPFGVEYDIAGGSVENLAAPSAKTYTASQVLREVDLVYSTCALRVDIQSNQLDDVSIDGLKATVSYGSTTKEVTSGEITDIPVNTSITITFPELEDYKKPDAITFTSVLGVNEKTGTYKTEKVVVLVNAADGVSVDGQTVTLRSGERMPLADGCYIQDTEGRCWTGDEWDGSKTPNGIAVIKDGMSFVMALNDLSEKKKMSENLANPTEATSYINGKSNTNALKSKYGSSTSYMIGAITSFTFPDGQKGYLWAKNQLSLACVTLKEQVNDLLTIAGGSILSSEYTSSTYTGLSESSYNCDYFWGLYDGTVVEHATDSSIEYYIRPITDFNYTPSYEDETKTISLGQAEFKVAYGTKYEVSVNSKSGYGIPDIQSFTASLPLRSILMSYVKIFITRIRIDLTLTDPDGMIERTIDEGGIEKIRENSHRYTGKLTNGVMQLKQLDDTKSTLYADGTTATLTSTSQDVWMKLPQFYWKCEQFAADIFDFTVTYGGKPDETYKEWDGKDLIGVYKGYVASSKLYSLSGKTVTTVSYGYQWRDYITPRGEGYSTVKWKHHCMMGMLFFTWYGTTDFTSVCGAGVASAKKTGQTNALGMTDTVAGGNGDSNLTNFWGLEDWNTPYYVEVIGDAVSEKEQNTNSFRLYVNSYMNVYNSVIHSPDERIVEGVQTGYVTKMVLGENIDLVSSTHNSGASGNIGYCAYMVSGGLDHVGRSGFLSLLEYNVESASTKASRLTYYGDYTII